MKLYYSPGACSLAPHIALREAGHEFEIERVDIPNKKTESGADYWEINPKGYVPALKLDDGDVLTEVAVILQYISDQNQAANLAPRFGTHDRYHLLEWLNFIATEVHKQIGALFNPKMTPEMKTVQLGVIERRMNALDKMLEGKHYLMGDDFSIADAYLFTILRWTTKLDIDLAKWPRVSAVNARVGERAEVIEAMKAEGLIK
ncbi:MAG TPA: glutathione transferase GstA [Burkholderiales bacterium]|nr:glutathione transferase GstA [Burkholderiales bacterium]